MKKLLVFILILHLIILKNLMFTAWPEMLSYPYLFSNGFTLYKDFILPYPPGLILILERVFRIFGFNVLVLQVFTWSLIFLADILVYLIISRMVKSNKVLLIFLLVFILLQSFLDGNMLWFDFAMEIPLLVGFLFFLNWLGKKKLYQLFSVGFCLALAVIIKQTAVIFLLFFVIYYLLITRKIILREIISLFLGGGLVFSILAVYLLVTNSTVEFWNWTIVYPLVEWSKFPGYVNFVISKKYILVTFLLLVPITGILFAFRKLIRDQVFLLSIFFLMAALLAVYPRFSFFHLQAAIVFAVIIFVKVFTILPQKYQQKYLSLICVVTMLIVMLVFTGVVEGGIRFYGQSDQKLAKFVSEQVKKNESVFLLGLNSSLYAYSNRLPPKSWSDNFGWYLEIPGVQEWMIKGFVLEMPKIILWKTPVAGNWYDLGVYQPAKITAFIRQNYQQAGKIDEGVEIWSRKN